MTESIPTILPAEHEDAATRVVGSDRYPYTIVARKGQRIWVRQDNFRGVKDHDNSYTEDQKYVYYSDESAPVEVWSLRKNGSYYRVGQEMARGSGMFVGRRRYYRDPSF